MIRNPTTYAEIVVSWETMIAAMTAESDKVPHLQERIDKLKGMVDRAHELFNAQDRAAADRQAASKELKTLMGEGQKLATFLRIGLKETFGNTAAELLAFGVKPFRRRRTSTPTEPSGSEPTSSPSSTPPSNPAA